MDSEGGFWCIFKHNGRLIGLTCNLGPVFALFDTLDGCDKFIMEAELEQHLSTGPYQGERIAELLEIAQTEFDYFTLNPEYDPGGQLNTMRIAPVLEKMADMRT